VACVVCGGLWAHLSTRADSPSPISLRQMGQVLSPCSVRCVVCGVWCVYVVLCGVCMLCCVVCVWCVVWCVYGVLYGVCMVCEWCVLYGVSMEGSVRIWFIVKYEYMVCLLCIVSMFCVLCIMGHMSDVRGVYDDL
jgi:hypothetical protein